MSVRAIARMTRMIALRATAPRLVHLYEVPQIVHVLVATGGSRILPLECERSDSGKRSGPHLRILEFEVERSDTEDRPDYTSSIVTCGDNSCKANCKARNVERCKDMVGVHVRNARVSKQPFIVLNSHMLTALRTKKKIQPLI